MDLDPNLSSLLCSLEVDDPWVPPKTWESIPSESGSNRSLDSAQKSQLSIDNLSSISETSLVRLAINALQGLKSAIVQIHHLSVQFCSTPADRTYHQVPSLWCRSSSSSALGLMLKSMSRSGLVFLYLQEFVNHYIYSSRIGENGDVHKNEMRSWPPYSLVNQAFSVAVGKVLEGYLSALNTLLASVKLRRSVKHDGTGILTSVVNSDITLLEVYLHTGELRMRIEALGNICLCKVEDLSAETSFEFRNFPRGADLLTYLYVLLRDADPGHHALLKFLFMQSCEPYCGFIKSWIYHARIDDPYGEFFVVYSHTLPDSNVVTTTIDDFSLVLIKERDGTSVPCFLKDVCCPLVRAGQQLEVLVKLLNVCNFAVNEEYESCNLVDLEGILPFWVYKPNNSASLRNQLTFSRKGIQALLQKREIMYDAVLKKLQVFFANLDARYQRMHRNVIPFGSLLGRRIEVNSPFYLISDGNLHGASTTNEQGALHVVAGAGDTDASTSLESLFDMERSQTSESSSWYGSEDEVEAGAFSELPVNLHQPSQCLFYNTHNARKSTLQKTEIEKPHSPQNFHNNCKTMGSIPLFEEASDNGEQNYENDKVSQVLVTIESDVSNCVKLSETFDDDYLTGKCWPLGALPKNPFYDDLKHRVPKQWQYSEFCQQKTNEKVENLEVDGTDFGEMFFRTSEFDATGKNRILEKTIKTLPLHIQQSWNSCDSYDLSVNPMLAKTAWLRTVRNVREKDLISNAVPCFPYFDFSSVSDPCEGYSEIKIASRGHESRGTCLRTLASASPVVGEIENYGESVRDNMTGRSALASSCSSREINDLPSGASGGSGWEGLLNYSVEDASFSDEDECCDPVGTFETPLDVIIDKCIVQEVLVQYKYVSNFTIRLLKDGFDLQEHLFALRRYHFMERADWADSFITSLHNQKWSSIEPEQGIARLQGLLDLALQRSSCGNDPYKEKLFIYAKGQNMVSQPTSAIGLHAFDFMLLGYRVDWPVNIIITQDALRTYAEIFSYLIRVRLAVVSLTDVWNWLKAGVYSTKQSQSTGSREMDFTTLMKLRQQINHFVHTLQEYVHSQLSDVSWCQFQHSLQHRVKDMLDLESVHNSYLADALHICFLSAETKPISTIIKTILQCALAFGLCFHGLADVQSDRKEPSDLHCQINFSQIRAIKTTFENSIKDLYILYLKSPKHGEFSLCRFWSYLNYNDYYSITIAKEMGRLYH